jgi:hypothetical protein
MGEVRRFTVSEPAPQSLFAVRPALEVGLLANSDSGLRSAFAL